MAVIVHGAPRVHEQQHLHRVLPGPLVAHLQHPAVVGGVLDGVVHVELGGGEVHQAGELPQPPQGHLELPGVQGVVLAKVPEPPLPGHPEGPAVHALAPHPDTLGGVAAVAEHRHAVGAHPIAAPVVLLGLLGHALLQHPLDLLLGEAQVFQGLGLIPGGIVGEDVGLVQPVQQLLGHLLLKGHVLEVLQEGAVEGVKVGLALYQQAAAQVVEAGEAGPVEPLVEGLHQGHPLGEGDVQPVAPQQVQEVLEHVLSGARAFHGPPSSPSVSAPDRLRGAAGPEKQIILAEKLYRLSRPNAS